MSSSAVFSFYVIALGFTLAGALVSLYQALANQPPGFGLLMRGATGKAMASVPFLVFAAPFLIMRNTLRGRAVENRGFTFVFVATVIAGFWSMMSGTFLVMALQAVGLLQG